MIVNRLQTIDIFNDISLEYLEKIAQISQIKSFRKDNILFYEGEEPQYFYALLEGNIKLFKTGFKANEIVLHHFTKATMIAEMASLEGIVFPATAVATKDDTKVVLIEKEKFITLLKKDSEFAFYIIKSLTKKIKYLEVAINRNLIFDSTTKVCSFIKENPNFSVDYKNIEVANILNMAPETLSRVLSKLKKLEILDKTNKIKNIEKLDMFLEL